MRNAEAALQQHRRWRRVQHVLSVVVVVNVALVVWAVNFRDSSGAAPVLPDTEIEFSLDLDVLATTEHDTVYVVEQRARPHYRIFELEPSTGEIDTVFTVPKDAIIYGIALSPDRDTLAVAYSPDFGLDGNAIWMLDLSDGSFEQKSELETGVYMTDIAWAGDAILATEVDRRDTEEQLTAVVLSATTGANSVRIDDAINPVQVGDAIYFLMVDEDKARRSIGTLDSDGVARVVALDNSTFDLDHLMADGDEGVRIAVLEDAKSGLTFGAAADAHGSHDVPSQWVDISLPGDDPIVQNYEPIIVYDAVATGNAIVYATKEGLAIASEQRVDLLASRAIRFVAG